MEPGKISGFVILKGGFMTKREKIIKMMENEIKQRKKLQAKFNKFYSQLSLEERKKLPDFFWEIFDKPKTRVL